MNKFFIGFLFLGISSEAQTTSLIGFTEQDKSHTSVNLDTSYFTRYAFQLNADLLSRREFGITSSAKKVADEKPLNNSDATTELPQKWSALQFACTVIKDNNSQPVSSIKIDRTDLFERIARDLPPNSQAIKPTFSDYVVLPNCISNFLEFHDHETTLSGTTVNLSTIKLTSVYDSNLPTSTINGATVVQNAIYKESIYGSGSSPWLTATAPNALVGTSIELNTSSNFLLENNKGAFGINISDGNSLQMATGDNGAYIGWTNPNQNTKLTLYAGTVDVTGHLLLEDSLTSKRNIIVGDPNLLNVNISYNSIKFADVHGVDSFIGHGYTIDSKEEDTFVLFSGYRGGINLNASNADFGSSNTISFLINSNIIGKFTNSGMVIGEGSLDPSAILAINSTNRGVRFPRFTDKQIFDITSPSEGLLVYSSDHHSPAFFNGSDWMFFYKTKKLRRPKM